MINGTCPIDKPFENEDRVYNIDVSMYIFSTVSRCLYLQAMTRYVLSKLFAYSFSSGHFYWNFRTELEYRWDFREVNWRGWMPLDLNSALAQKEIDTICKRYLDPVVPKKETEFHDLLIYAQSHPLGTAVALVLFGTFVWAARKYLSSSKDNFPYTTIEDGVGP